MKPMILISVWTLGITCVVLHEVTPVVTENPADPCSPNPCLNGASCSGNDGGKFMCKCREGYIGKRCSTPSCDCTWRRILITDSDGNELYGCKKDLADSVLQGYKLRIHFNDVFADVQNAIVLNETLVCMQSLFHISRNGWDRHQEDAYWRFLNLCTSGNVHISRWYVGDHSQPSGMEDRAKYKIHWFVRNYCGFHSTPASPVYCNSEKGETTCGSISNLNDAIDKGYAIDVVDTKERYADKSTNIDRNAGKTIVSSQHVWHVSQAITPGGYEEFQHDAYWWFTIVSSDSDRYITRWSVGEFVNHGRSNDKRSMNWFADTCWKFVYENDKNGNAVSGSLENLKSAVLAGKRVRLQYFTTYTIEADTLIVLNGRVTAQVLGHVSKIGKKTFQSSSYWYWQNVDTMGNVNTVRYFVGKHVIRNGKNFQKENVKWFVEERPWKLVFANSKNEGTIFGSKCKLLKHVKHGGMVRFSVNFASKPNDQYVFVFNGDNIRISPDWANLSAQHVRMVSVQRDESDDISFQQSPSFVFTIATTTGKIDQSKWTVGEHVNRGRDNVAASIKWFVN